MIKMCIIWSVDNSKNEEYTVSLNLRDLMAGTWVQGNHSIPETINLRRDLFRFSDKSK